MKNTPTSEFYNLLQFCYTHYNTSLFDGELPNCMFVVIRKKSVFGSFSPERWVNQEKIKSDEISINPLMFGQYPLIEILQTMVHEMCHLWQHHFGTSSRLTYHNSEWGSKMEKIGLIPSDTGKPGGKKTGQQMLEYIDPTGNFLVQSKILIEDNVFQKLWYDRFSTPATLNYLEPTFDLSFTTQENETTQNTIPIRQRFIESIEFQTQNKKTKYTCACNTNLWGKPGLNIRCNDCGEDFNCL